MIDYSSLNPEQNEAVFNDSSRILCLAGAGTGKTQVLTRRVARLWEQGVSPENMLALTFTRAAGAEMKERVIGLIGADGKKLFCNTFHAFCVEVIRENAATWGYEQNFTVYDQQECDELLAEVFSDLKFKIPAKRVADFRAGKTEGMTAIDRKQAERADNEYEYRLKRNNAIDFDGLIETVQMAIKHNVWAASVRGRTIPQLLFERYKYIFVDEFQDTDSTQWSIVQSLCPENLFVVGDDFQAIYGFRGSDISIILSLANDPECHTVKLERNYRSTQPIIEAANTLIKHNTQTEKKLTTEKPGAVVDYREPGDDESEITDIIPRLLENQQADRQRTTAILARTNNQLKNAKAILKARGVPCDTKSTAENPLTGKRARDLMAWIAAIINPMDDTAMRRIALSKIGRAALEKAEQRQFENGLTFTEALRETPGGADFLAYYNEQSLSFLNSQDVATGANRLSIHTGIECYDALYAIGEWQIRQEALGESALAADLLEHVRLSNIIGKPERERDASKTYLMTVHGSKGLEFDEVFIIGAVQSVFPNRGDLQEERRLFYVAITRAREYLNVSRPLTMSDWGGNAKPTERSQFIAESAIG